MPRYTLEAESTLPTKLELRPGPQGTVELVASGGPGNDEQVLLSLHPDGYFFRAELSIEPAQRLGLKMNDNGVMFLLHVDEPDPRPHWSGGCSDVED